MLPWLSCERFCKCASLKLDGDVPWYKNLGYVFHYLLCFPCRRYCSQVTVIDKALCKCGDADDCSTMEDCQKEMSPECRGRIEAALKDETGTDN